MPMSVSQPVPKLQEAPAEQKTPPPKAAPEDLQKIMESWKAIVGETSGRFKEMLLRSIPKYNGQTGDSILYVEFQDFLAQPYVEGKEGKEKLEALIADKTGKSVQVEMLMAKGNHQGDLAELSVDDIIKENIHINVEIED